MAQTDGYSHKVELNYIIKNDYVFNKIYKMERNADSAKLFHNA